MLILTNDIVSFEPLGPALLSYQYDQGIENLYVTLRKIKMYAFSLFLFENVFCGYSLKMSHWRCFFFE